MLSYSLAAAILPLLTIGAPQYGYADSSSSSSSISISASMTSSMIMNATATVPSGAAPSATSVGNVTSHVVVIGGGPLVYTPNFVNAAIGDQIIFEFHKANHSVTQTSFASPCSPLAVNGTSVGIDSGFVPVGGNSTVFPTFTITVSETSPLWFACKQGEHCKLGMGFGINPPTSGNTIEAFIAKAMNSTEGFNSTSAIPSNNGTGVDAQSSVSQIVSGSATGTPAKSTSSATSGSTRAAVGGFISFLALALAVGIIV